MRLGSVAPRGHSRPNLSGNHAHPARRGIPALTAALGDELAAAAGEGAAERKKEPPRGPQGRHSCRPAATARTAESRRCEGLPYGTVAKSAGGDYSADHELARHVTGCVGGRTARARPGGSSSGAGIPGDCGRRLAASSARVEVQRGRRRTFSQGGVCSARGRSCRSRRLQD